LTASARISSGVLNFAAAFAFAVAGAGVAVAGADAGAAAEGVAFEAKPTRASSAIGGVERGGRRMREC
jgi:hypothetical protein